MDPRDRLSIAIDAMQVGHRPAGVGRYVTELLTALDDIVDDDEDVTAYVSHEGAVMLRDTLARVRLVAGPARTPFRRILRQQVVIPWRMAGSSVVHYPDYLVPLVRRPTPFVVTVHDVGFWADASYFPVARRLLRRLASSVGTRHATRIIADSEFTRSEILRVFPRVDPVAIRVVYPGTPRLASGTLSNWNETVSKYRLPPKYVLSVCTLEPRKNLRMLLHAFATPALRTESLVLVGGTGWGPGIRDILDRDPHLSDRVTITGYVPDSDLGLIYRNATAFAYVSLYEGFGLPVLEAMSMGIPVVASDIPVLREVAGGGARFVDPTSPAGIAAGIAVTLSNVALRDELVSEGRARAASFTWRRCAEQTLDVYREVAAVRRGSRRSA